LYYKVGKIKKVGKVDKLIKPDKPDKPGKPGNGLKPTSVGFMRLSDNAMKPTLFDEKCKTM